MTADRSGVERAVPGSSKSEYVPLTWDELAPYEQQQGGYWLYGTDLLGADKRWIPVGAPRPVADG